jgi:hypothetical protein
MCRVARIATATPCDANGLRALRIRLARRNSLNIRQYDLDPRAVLVPAEGLVYDCAWAGSWLPPGKT